MAPNLLSGSLMTQKQGCNASFSLSISTVLYIGELYRTLLFLLFIFHKYPQVVLQQLWHWIWLSVKLPATVLVFFSVAAPLPVSESSSKALEYNFQAGRCAYGPSAMMVTHLQPLAEGDLKLLKPIVASITTCCRSGPSAPPTYSMAGCFILGWGSVWLTAQLNLLSE